MSEFFQEKDLVDLTFAIANINAWNRLGVAFRASGRGSCGWEAGRLRRSRLTHASEETAAE